MKKSKTIIAALLLVLLNTMKAQDILEQNGTKTKIKIIEETSQGIKYILWDK